MSFGAEVKDFVSAFQVGSNAVQGNERIQNQKDAMAAQANYLAARQHSLEQKTNAITGLGNTPDPATQAGNQARNEYDNSGSTPSAKGTDPEVADYIRTQAIAKGIDPNVALTVAAHEGGIRVGTAGDGNSSFGPFQLHYAGINPNMPHAGIGDDFTAATGLHASDPSTWKQQVDFALDTVKQRGWSPWMGAAAAGIHGFTGVNGRQVAQAAPAPQQPQAPPQSLTTGAAPATAIPVPQQDDQQTEQADQAALAPVDDGQ